MKSWKIRVESMRNRLLEALRLASEYIFLLALTKTCAVKEDEKVTTWESVRNVWESSSSVLIAYWNQMKTYLRFVIDVNFVSRFFFRFLQDGIPAGIELYDLHHPRPAVQSEKERARLHSLFSFPVLIFRVFIRRFQHLYTCVHHIGKSKVSFMIVK